MLFQAAPEDAFDENSVLADQIDSGDLEGNYSSYMAESPANLLTLGKTAVDKPAPAPEPEPQNLASSDCFS